MGEPTLAIRKRFAALIESNFCELWMKPLRLINASMESRLVQKGTPTRFSFPRF